MTEQTVEGFSANALATISVALSGLYSAWTGTTGPRPRRAPNRTKAVAFQQAKKRAPDGKHTGEPR